MSVSKKVSPLEMPTVRLTMMLDSWVRGYLAELREAEPLRKMSSNHCWMASMAPMPMGYVVLSPAVMMPGTFVPVFRSLETSTTDVLVKVAVTFCRVTPL